MELVFQVHGKHIQSEFPIPNNKENFNCLGNAILMPIALMDQTNLIAQNQYVEQINSDVVVLVFLSILFAQGKLNVRTVQMSITVQVYFIKILNTRLFRIYNEMN